MAGTRASCSHRDTTGLAGKGGVKATACNPDRRGVPRGPVKRKLPDSDDYRTESES